MAIVITGASGQLGRRVAEEVLERVPAGELILVTRNPDALGGYARRGVEVRTGDFGDPSTLPRALAGGKRMLLISTNSFGSRIEHHAAAIDAAARAGLEFVAYTSFVRPDKAKPAGIPAEHSATEDTLRGSGLGWCILRNSVYADLEAGNMAVAGTTGKLITNHGSGRVGYVARDDCAAAAAAILAGDGQHAGKVYDLTGPEALDADDRAAIFSELGGQPVEVVQVDGTEDSDEARMIELGRYGTFHRDEGYAAALAKTTGMPPEAASMFASFGLAIRAGLLDLVTPAVEDLTGRPPLTLRSVLEAQLARGAAGR